MYRPFLTLISAMLLLGLLCGMVSAASLKPDLLWWKFDEGSGTVATDSSGSGHDGVFEGNPTWVAGMIGGALEFSGGGERVVDADAGDYLNGLDAVTIAVWIKSDEINSDRGFVIGEEPDGGDNLMEMRYDAAGATAGGTNVLKMAVVAPNDEQQLESSSNVQTTEWQHVAMVWSRNAQLQCYIDGELDTPAANGAARDVPTSDVTMLIVGQGGKDAGRSWDGLIDDVQIYSQALTAEQIQMAMMGLAPAELASEPNPAEEATDVPLDVMMSWTPGETAAAHDVYLGTAFEDVNNASRANPMDVLVSQGQTAASYMPEALEFNTTYYWRIDEVNAAPDNTVFKGNVWSFTTEPYAYPITNIIATSNATSDAASGPEKTVDGSGLDANNGHSTDASDMWLGLPAGEEPVYIQYEFPKAEKLYEMWVWNYNVEFEPVLGFGVKDVTIEYSTDGADWTMLKDAELAQASATAGYQHNTVVGLEGVAAKYIRLTVNSNWGMLTQYGLSEVRFFYIPVQAREPQPANGATDIDPATTLSWRIGREATSHEVYFGTDAADLALVDTTNQTSSTPGELDLGATYYWRVDEVGEETWTGEVWSFSTLEYLVVDGFETYNDDIDTGTTIFDTWVDGWVNGNGSTVGYFDAPFAEQAIVHSGAQSMPLQYDNTAAPSYSEGERTFDAPQDWTANGVKSLSLYFQGAPDNTGQLYVKINGTKVPYDGDPGDIAKTAWLPWNIDLSTVGNVRSVDTLVIGVEGSGSTGIIYIDDIRLYPKAPEYITPTEPDAANLVAQYEFEGNANDSSGNGLNGTIVDGQIVASGRPDGGMALQVDDAGYADLGNPPQLDFSTTDWTVTAWYKTGMTGTGDDNKGTIYGKGGDTGGGHRYCLIMSETTEGVVTLICDDDVTKYVVNSTSVTNDDEWHAVVGQRKGAELRIFIDGILEGSDTATAEYNLAGTSQHNAYIGEITNHGTGDLYKTYIGLIDDVRVYDKALSEGELLWLAGQTAPVAKPF